MSSNGRFVSAANLLVGAPKEEYTSVILTQLREIRWFDIQGARRRTIPFRVNAMARCARPLKLRLPRFCDVLLLR
jgi:hypothetical protein